MSSHGARQPREQPKRLIESCHGDLTPVRQPSLLLRRFRIHNLLLMSWTQGQALLEELSRNRPWLGNPTQAERGCGTLARSPGGPRTVPERPEQVARSQKSLRWSFFAKHPGITPWPAAQADESPRRSTGTPHSARWGLGPRLLPGRPSMPSTGLRTGGGLPSCYKAPVGSLATPAGPRGPSDDRATARTRHPKALHTRSSFPGQLKMKGPFLLYRLWQP